MTSGWLQKSMRMIQINLHEIDTTLDVDALWLLEELDFYIRRWLYPFCTALVILTRIGGNSYDLIFLL